MTPARLFGRRWTTAALLALAAIAIGAVFGTLRTGSAAIAVKPTNQSPPTISGTAQEGSTLTAGNGTWSGTTPITFTYQWQRCDATGKNCAAITGQTHEHLHGAARRRREHAVDQRRGNELRRHRLGELERDVRRHRRTRGYRLPERHRRDPDRRSHLAGPSPHRGWNRHPEPDHEDVRNDPAALRGQRLWRTTRCRGRSCT